MWKISLKVAFNVLVFTSIIGLAISYISQLLSPYTPNLNFLEAVGIYCLWTPIHHGLSSLFNKKELED